MEVRELTSIEQKQTVTQLILATLPEWFGLPESTAEYVERAGKLPCLAFYDGQEVVGILTLNQRTTVAAEIDVMGILPTYHRQGIGQALMTEALNWCRKKHLSYLQVKTLADSHPDPYYAKTRAFYRQMGFVELEVFPLLWGADNPCLQMIMTIED